MLEICKYLDVCKKDSIPDGVLVEDCEETEVSLEGYAIICREHNLEEVRLWIEDNIKNNVEHCLKLFEHSPNKLFQYFLVVNDVQSYTYEFIKDSGGVQAFFDKYIAPLQKIQETVNNVDMQSDFEKVNAESEVNTESEEMSKENEGMSKEMSEENQKEIETENSIEKSDESSTSESSTERTIKDDLSVEIRKDLEQTTQEELKSSLKKEILAEIEKEELKKKEEELIKREEELTKREEELKKREEVKIEVKEFQEYNPELLREITDESFKRTLEILDKLSNKFNLDGLDPKFILEQKDLEKVHAQLVKYPPSLFKAFILDMLKGEKEPLALCRITALLDDFVMFINNQEG